MITIVVTTVVVSFVATNAVYCKKDIQEIIILIVKKIKR